MERKTAMCDVLALKLAQSARDNTLPAISCIVSGLAAYLFVFTNKLLNLDEIAGLFGKGESISSGRWALALTSYIFPDVSLPWFNGILSLLMLTAAVLLILHVFEIKNTLLRLLIPALIITFPSQTVTFTYMFTCAPYALAVLLAAGSVYLTLCRSDKLGFAAGCVLLMLSLGIYQAYLSIAASLYVVYLIKRTIEGEWQLKRIIRCGFTALAAMAAALILYYVINKLVMLATGTEYNSYADASFQTDIKSVLFGVRVAFTAFLGYFYKGYYHLVATEMSKYMHYVLLIVLGIELAACFFKQKEKGRRSLLAALIILFPLSVNCLYIISTQRHTLMLYSFASLYILAAVTAESLMKDRHIPWRRCLCAVLAVIAVCNIFYANRLYLKMKLEYENAYSFYTGVITRIKETPGYDENTMVLISGEAHELLHESTEIDTSDLVGVMEGLINIYSRDDFFTYYAGFSPPTFDWAQWDASGASEELESMPIYPNDGSVKKIGDFIVVKLG